LDAPAIVDSGVAMTRQSPVSFRKNTRLCTARQAASVEPDG
jgi:hypothetical protein